MTVWVFLPQARMLLDDQLVWIFNHAPGTPNEARAATGAWETAALRPLGGRLRHLAHYEAAALKRVGMVPTLKQLRDEPPDNYGWSAIWPPRERA